MLYPYSGATNEYQFQKFIVKQLKASGKFKHIIHIKNEGKRTVREAAAMKALGYAKGVPDLLLLDHQMKPYFIEVKWCPNVKKPKEDWGYNRLSEHQKLFVNDLLTNKVYTRIWYLDEQVINDIKEM